MAGQGPARGGGPARQPFPQRPESQREEPQRQEPKRQEPRNPSQRSAPACARFRSMPSSPTKTAIRSAGLPSDDFEVTERGKPQPITTFEAVDIPIETQLPDLADADVVTNEGDGRIYLIVIDNISAPERRVREARTAQVLDEPFRAERQRGSHVPRSRTRQRGSGLHVEPAASNQRHRHRCRICRGGDRCGRRKQRVTPGYGIADSVRSTEASDARHVHRKLRVGRPRDSQSNGTAP